MDSAARWARWGDCRLVGPAREEVSGFTGGTACKFERSGLIGEILHDEVLRTNLSTQSTPWRDHLQGLWRDLQLQISMKFSTKISMSYAPYDEILHQHIDVLGPTSTKRLHNLRIPEVPHFLTCQYTHPRRVGRSSKQESGLYMQCKS